MYTKLQQRDRREALRLKDGQENQELSTNDYMTAEMQKIYINIYFYNSYSLETVYELHYFMEKEFKLIKARVK